MKTNLLKVKTKTCYAYFQINSNSDKAICVISTDHEQMFPGQLFTMKQLSSLVEIMDNFSIEEV